MSCFVSLFVVAVASITHAHVLHDDEEGAADNEVVELGVEVTGDPQEPKEVLWELCK